MRIIDLSQPLYDDAPNCPAHPPVKVEIIATHEEVGWRVEHLSLASHTGSHVDAPLHKLAGSESIDDIPLERWVGPAYIADLRGLQPNEQIDGAMLERKLPADLNDCIVLLATGWGDKRAKTPEWLHDSPMLDPDGAQWLVDHEVRGVGIDHYSIGGSRDPINTQTHTILLGNLVWIVEELRFPDEVFSLPQPVQFWSLPINLRGFTGAFCRPVIVAEDQKPVMRIRY
jgi:kynurenine formamidase